MHMHIHPHSHPPTHTPTPTPIHTHPYPPHTLVAINGHEAISLVVGIGAGGPVDRDLMEVGAKTMTVGVII